ncbi:GNAT family N-acetyltransferase [Dactylosporangium siamense]|uniref:Acetyltransferase n=1 Tax=Dactylosporangium siamense TaxID=685454 RepID=A0A919PTN7_9ACTN|nr:GNAT family N-acetyltransferase [Dactylosporangium siamense]GIG49984.1 acetyltransferase [Dactylosporangium siamense]
MIDRIHCLTLDDLPDCLALAQDREWLPEEHKWRLLFDVGTVYGLRNEAGELVGTAILTRYGTRLAAISMVLVAARYGGRGLGRLLMQHALAEAGDATVFLNATEHGRPLYEKLGFVSVGTTYTHVGRFEPSAGPAGSRPAVPGDLPAILKLDAEVNGADRSHLVERLPGFAEQLRVVVRGRAVSGYAGAWRNVDNVLIGPVLAATVNDAKTLIADLAATIRGPVRLDLDDQYPQLREWATQHAVPVRNSTAVMVRGARPLPGDRGRWFIPVMQALG